MSQCTAIIYDDGTMCRNIGKYNGFCGVHRTDKPNLCQGITRCGKGCRRTVKRGVFCGLHLIPEEPDHDWEELRLYKPDVNWPNMKLVLRYISKQKNGAQVKSLIERQTRDLTPSSYFYGETHLTAEHETWMKNRLIIVKMQTFFVNYYIDYSSEHWQSMIKELVESTENLKWLSEYRTLFRKKFDHQYRVEMQKMYIEKVLSKSVLGIYISKKIVEKI